jgi:transposase
VVDVAREKIVPLEAVAEKFDVSLQTVRNWANSSKHRLETIRVGRLVRTSWEAVQRFAIQRDTQEESSVIQTITRPSVSSTHEDSVRRLRERGLQF